MFRHHVLVDETGEPLPLIARFTKYVCDLESPIADALQVIQLVVEKDVALGLVAVEHEKLRLVLGIKDGSGEESESGTQPGASEHQRHSPEMLLPARHAEPPPSLVNDVPPRPPHVDLLPDGDVGENVGERAPRLLLVRKVGFDGDLERPAPVVQAPVLSDLDPGSPREHWFRGAVRADEHLVPEMECELDVLAGAYAHVRRVLWQLEFVHRGIVCDPVPFEEGAWHPSVFLQSMAFQRLAIFQFHIILIVLRTFGFEHGLVPGRRLIIDPVLVVIAGLLLALVGFLVLFGWLCMSLLALRSPLLLTASDVDRPFLMVSYLVFGAVKHEALTPRPRLWILCFILQNMVSAALPTTR